MPKTSTRQPRFFASAQNVSTTWVTNKSRLKHYPVECSQRLGRQGFKSFKPARATRLAAAWAQGIVELAGSPAWVGHNRIQLPGNGCPYFVGAAKLGIEADICTWTLFANRSAARSKL